MGDPRTRRVDRLQFPAPKMPRRWPPRLGRCPGNASALVEFDYAILPDVARGGRHQEHVTRAANPLPGRRLGQVVVAVPAWLLSRVHDELEDLLRPCCDLATGADNAGNLIVTCHTSIEAPDAERSPPSERASSNARTCLRVGRAPMPRSGASDSAALRAALTSCTSTGGVSPPWSAT